MSVEDEDASPEVREANKREAHARLLLEADIRRVMSDAGGRRFVWWMLDGVAGAFGPSFSGDALQTAYKEGRRSVGLALLVEAQRVCPAYYVDMLREMFASMPVVVPLHAPTPE